MVDKKKNKLQSLLDKFKNLFSKPSPVYGVCSRNLMLGHTGESNFHKAVDKYSLFKKMDAIAESTHSHSIALQGELLAPSIQANHEKVKDIEWHCFDIFNIELQEYWSPDLRWSVSKSLGIPHVTLISKNKLRDILQLPEGDVETQQIQKACLDFAEGEGDNVGVMREGVVFKHAHKNFSFKAISNLSATSSK